MGHMNTQTIDIDGTYYEVRTTYGRYGRRTCSGFTLEGSRIPGATGRHNVEDVRRAITRWLAS